MQMRYRAAATALLLTATGGLAATQGAADASGAHHAATRAATRLTVTITSTAHGPKLSSTTVRPGKTMFKVVRGNAGGSMQLLRLRAGYSKARAVSDFGKLFSGQSNKRVVRRVDKNIVFYGGMGVPGRGESAKWWGTNLDARDTYYVVNLKKGTMATLKVRGAHQRRSFPATHGHINMADTSTGANVFRTSASIPHRGWTRSTNRAMEPHFVVLNRVAESTTRADVAAYFASGAQGAPSFGRPGGWDTNVISPGHTFIWKYHVPRGKYVVMCFWPSKMDGQTPHAFMGMFNLFHMS